MRCRRACRGEEWRVAAHDYAFLSLRIIHMNESRHTCEWVTAHVWMRRLSHMCTWRHVTHTNESCHTYGWVTAHIWMSHGTYTNEAPESYVRMTTCHTYEWVMSHIWMSHGTYMNESRHMYEWGSRVVCAHDDMSRIRMSHVTHMIESRHIYEWVTAHIWMRLPSRMRAWRHIPVAANHDAHPVAANDDQTSQANPVQCYNTHRATIPQMPQYPFHFSTIPTKRICQLCSSHFSTIPTKRFQPLFYNTHERFVNHVPACYNTPHAQRHVTFLQYPRKCYNTHETWRVAAHERMTTYSCRVRSDRNDDARPVTANGGLPSWHLRILKMIGLFGRI